MVDCPVHGGQGLPEIVVAALCNRPSRLYAKRLLARLCRVLLAPPPELAPLKADNSISVGFAVDQLLRIQDW